MLLKNNIPFSYVFGQIKYEVLLVSIYGIAIELIELGYKSITAIEFSIPLTVPTILGTVISLLLAFRSNQSYERWWEARIVWGAIVNDSRTLSRQVLSLIESNEENDELDRFRKKFITRQIAWNFALAKSLRNGIALPYIEKFLSPDEFEYVAKFDNVPYALLDLHAKDLKFALQKGWLNRFQQIAIDDTITRLCDSMGKCERIKKTVFPSTYGLYIHFALWVFTLSLPFALIDLFGFIMVPVLVILSTCFFLIEKMAIQLQDPFENKPTDTPVMTISRTIERDLKQMMEESEIPLEMEKKEFYVM
ncbi:MAG TPA: bestrophin family ion channel [Bacteroidia bacterium]